MCLAVPMRVIAADGVHGRAELDGVVKEVNLGFLEDVRVGQYVLVHAGFAIESLNEAEAERSLAELKDLIAESRALAEHDARAT